MIKITKPIEVPGVLLTRGKDKQRVHCDDYLAHPEDYATGTRKFAFDQSIYGHATVKDALERAQHGKCAFCERRFGGDCDVEHFRPKAACLHENGHLVRPGYYWLAYDWDNLLLVCPMCNQRHKRSQFPLANPAGRATSHESDLSGEEPLFINPAKNDPERHITFEKAIMAWENWTGK